MDEAEGAIVALNVVLGCGAAWLLSWLFERRTAVSSRRLRVAAALLIVYLVEGVAFMASMGTYLLSIGSAVAWAWLLVSWLRRNASVPPEKYREIAIVFGLYCSLPAVSFLAVPVILARGGWPIASTDAGRRFGIPAFVPWPASTILGFSVGLALLGIMVKVGITTCIVRWKTGSHPAHTTP